MKDTFFVIAHMTVPEKDMEHLFFALNRFLADNDTRRSIPKSSGTIQAKYSLNLIFFSAIFRNRSKKNQL
jgi:hypothetical protein